MPNDRGIKISGHGDQLFWERKKHPGDEEWWHWTPMVSRTETWLNGESVQSLVVTPEVESNLVVANKLVADDKVSIQFTDGEIGKHIIRIEIETPTRKLVRDVGLVVE